MEYKKIKNLVYNNNLIDRYDFKRKWEYELEVNKLLITNLQRCIDNKVGLEMDEIDFVEIYKVYLKLLKYHFPIDKDFIINISNLSVKKLDYLGIIQEITE